MRKGIKYLLVIIFLMIVGMNGVKAAKTTDCSKEKLSQDECDACHFVYNKEYKFCSNTGLVYVACGLTSKNANYTEVCKGNKGTVGMGAYDIPPKIPEMTAFIVNALKIVTPIILIFIGMITMVKALASSNEDEIKKAENSLIKKIIIAVMVFFVVGITQFVIDTVSGSKSLNSCLDLFLNGNYNTVYYRTGSGGNKCISMARKK